MGHDYYDYMKDMCRHYRTLFGEMGRDAQGYYWKKSAGDSWESAEPAEPQERQEPQTAREKLEQAEVAEYEVLDDSSMGCSALLCFGN